MLSEKLFRDLDVKSGVKFIWKTQGDYLLFLFPWVWWSLQDSESVLLLLSSLSSTTDNNTLKVISNHVKIIFKVSQQIAVAFLLNELLRAQVTEFLRPLLLPKFSDFKIRYFSIFQYRYLFLSNAKYINIVGNSWKKNSITFCFVRLSVYSYTLCLTLLTLAGRALPKRKLQCPQVGKLCNVNSRNIWMVSLLYFLNFHLNFHYHQSSINTNSGPVWLSVTQQKMSANIYQMFDTDWY